MPRTKYAPAWLLCLLPLAVWAQQAPAPAPAPASAMPRPEQLEPGVNTSAPESAPVSSDADTATAAPAKKAAPGAQKPPAAPAPAPKQGEAKNAPRKAGPDRLQLDATDITGNRELPKVLYIVPWKRSDLGDLAGRPPNSLLDDVLQPLDRDVFQRENRYYDALKPDATAAPPPASDARPNNP
jgi:hypothetical protein